MTLASGQVHMDRGDLCLISEYLPSLWEKASFYRKTRSSVDRAWAVQRDFCLGLDFAVYQLCDLGWQI